MTKFKMGDRVAWMGCQADPENGPKFDSFFTIEGTVVEDGGIPNGCAVIRIDETYINLEGDGEFIRSIPRQWLRMPPHEHCVICQNEGLHGFDRPHVMEGQE